MWKFLRATVVALALLSATARAVVLDWDSVTWGNGTLSNSYDIDPTSAGNDVTLTASGNTDRLEPALVTPNPATPAITTALQGGLSPAQRSLEIAVDLSKQNQFITITVDFSALYAKGVTDVSFTIFDVDFSNDSANSNQFQDQLRAISALSIDGVTTIAPTITNSSANTRTGTGVSQVVTGTSTAVDTSGTGNVTISFGTNAIKSFTFTYGSGSGTINNPTYQHIGIHDISFRPVPEINPAWSAFVSCLAVSGLVLRHRSILRRKK